MDIWLLDSGKNVSENNRSQYTLTKINIGHFIYDSYQLFIFKIIIRC